MVLLVVTNSINSDAKYYIYASLGIFEIIYLFKYKFAFKVFERILFLIQEGIVLTLFSLFIFNSSYIIDNNLDFFGLLIVVVL